MYENQVNINKEANILNQNLQSQNKNLIIGFVISSIIVVTAFTFVIIVLFSKLRQQNEKSAKQR